MRPRRVAITATLVGMAAAVVPAVATATTASGHSGWEWASPTPTGNTLDAVNFAGSTGFAVGEDGAMLRSDDGGLTWRGLASRTTANLNSLTLAGPGVLAAGGQCVARRSVDGGTSVARLALSGGEDVCPANVLGVSVIDAAFAYVVRDDGSVAFTTNGGISFGRRTSLPGSRSAGGFDVPTTMVALSTSTLVAAVGPTIVRSVDGANSWTTVAQGLAGNPAIHGITFVSGTKGYAVGSGQILTTNDGGATWQAITRTTPTIPIPGLRRIACADANVCLMTIDGSTQLVRTTDGGVTLQLVTPSSSILKAVAFASPTRAVAVGVGGTIVVSDDAGVTWRPVSAAAAAAAATRLTVSGASVTGVGPNGTVVRSLDGGNTWTTASVTTSADIVAAAFPTASTGFALDATGAAFKTMDGGVTWQVLSAGIRPAPSAGIGLPPIGLVALSPRQVVVYSGATMRRSLDGGATFAPFAGPVKRTKSSQLFVARGRLFFAGEKSLWMSRGVRGGWQRFAVPARARIREVACVSATHCWLLTAGRQVYMTRNQGRAWTNLSLALGRPFDQADYTGIAAQSPQVAYVRTSAGRVLATTDGGRSWRSQRVGPMPIASLAASPVLAAAVDARGSVFTTRTNGDAGTVARLTLRATPPRTSGRSSVVTLSGVLSPADGGETVVITTSRGTALQATVGANGRYSVTTRVGRTTGFSAQVVGDGQRSGAGTPVVTVTRR